MGDSVNVLPANQSLVIADSTYKEPNDGHYNFVCKLSGSGIYCKELYYNQLYWSQPLFAHNNGNCELIFTVNDDDTTLYVVYATPFILYNDFDGNPAGTSLLPPQPFSYCKNMELGFNNDVRLLSNNAVIVNGDGKIRDGGGNIMTFCFRYAPSKGFCIYPIQDNPLGNVYTIKLWPCSYISYAHFTHGFGIINPSINALIYVPRTYYSPVIWSDTVPNLMPYRYVIIASNELTKDRRLMSFSNALGNSKVTSELAVFSTNPSRTRIYQAIPQGESSSVVSLRPNYTPQNFDISINSELGVPLRCGDGCLLALEDSAVSDSAKQSFWSTPLRGRGNDVFMNTLLFGYNWKQGTPGPTSVQSYISWQNGMALGPDGYWNVNFQGELSNNPLNFFTQAISIGFRFPIGLNDSNPFASSIQNCGIYNASQLGHDFSNHFITYFTWDSVQNRTPYLSLDLNVTLTSYAPDFFGDTRYMLFMYSATNAGNNSFYYANSNSVPLAIWDIYRTPNDQTNLLSPHLFSAISTTQYPCQLNPGFNDWIGNYPKPSAIPVVFYLIFYFKPVVNPGPTDHVYSMVTGPALVNPNIPSFNFYGPGTTPIDPATHVYNPPITAGPYPFGDPLADAKCEPVIHEIVTVLAQS
jgi:hypothetical protein